MIIFRKARNPQQTLNDLDEYLRTVGDKPVRWLAREVQSWGEFSYDEIAALIESGQLDALIDWQERWAGVVNGTLAPMWLKAIEEASRKATNGMTVLSDSNDYVKAWVTSHGGELITLLSDESRKAISNLLLRGQGLRMAPRDIAREIRPLIGLTDRQAQANVKYKDRVYQKYLDNGLSESKARERSEAAALKYAGKQHRYRAESIVLTENAFAYNRGAHMGVSQSIADGYMGRCEMVWTTAGTNRVCGRCMELKDTVVGYTDQSGVTIPPLHPRCRCAIMYREVGTPRVMQPNRENKPKPLALPAGTTDNPVDMPKFPSNFVPAKTIAEANEFAIKTLNVARAEYKGCDIAVANEWNFGLLETFEKFPELKNFIRFVGEAHERNDAIERELMNHYIQDLTARHPKAEATLIKKSAEFYVSMNMEKIKILKEQVALFWRPTASILKEFGGVVVNREIGKDYRVFKEILEYNVGIKQRPVGCNTIRSCLDHEIGHLLDDLLNLSSLPEIRELFESRVQIINGAKDFSKITEDLSRYAWDNITENRYAEFIADAWAEYCNNSAPREIAQKVGQIVEREYIKIFREASKND